MFIRCKQILEKFLKIFINLAPDHEPGADQKRTDSATLLANKNNCSWYTVIGMPRAQHISILLQIHFVKSTFHDLWTKFSTQIKGMNEKREWKTLKICIHLHSLNCQVIVTFLPYNFVRSWFPKKGRSVRLISVQKECRMHLQNYRHNFCL